MIEKKHTNWLSDDFLLFFCFVSSLAALSEADATLALCHNVLFVQSHYVMLRDELFANQRALYAHN